MAESQTCYGNWQPNVVPKTKQIFDVRETDAHEDAVVNVELHTFVMLSSGKSGTPTSLRNTWMTPK